MTDKLATITCMPGLLSLYPTLIASSRDVQRIKSDPRGAIKTRGAAASQTGNLFLTSNQGKTENGKRYRVFGEGEQKSKRESPGFSFSRKNLTIAIAATNK